MRVRESFALMSGRAVPLLCNVGSTKGKSLTFLSTAVIRFWLDYMAIFKGKSHNCRSVVSCQRYKLSPNSSFVTFPYSSCGISR